MPGPPPKREAQRRRRNKTGVEHAAADGVQRAPVLEGDHSSVAVRFWESLGRSGQAQFFQPSDWSQAELVVLAIDAFVEKPAAMMLASINSMMSNLLVTEGDRRRTRLELKVGEPQSDPDEERAVAQLDDFRNRLSG